MGDQLPVDVFVQQAGAQCLVRNAFLQGARLQVFQVPAGNADVQGASGFAAAIGERFAFVEHRLGVAAQRGLHPHGGEGRGFHARSVMQM